MRTYCRYCLKDVEAMTRKLIAEKRAAVKAEEAPIA